ncbi:MAG: choice-of-anchor tandem repeat NxxGxxAF-containing protein [Planctomycetota bacterium]
MGQYPLLGGIFAIGASAVCAFGQPEIRVVALSNTQAPGLDPGVLMSGFDFENIRLNNAGQAAFGALLSGTGVVVDNNRAVFSEGGGAGLDLVVRSGVELPSTPTGVFLSSADLIQLNNSGEIAFFALLNGATITSSNNEAVFSSGDRPQLTMIAREGEPASGVTGAVDYGSFISSSLIESGALQLTDLGRTAFRARLVGAGVGFDSDIATFAEVGVPGPSAFAREGNSVPGLDPSVVYENLSDFRINNSSELAIISSLDAPIAQFNNKTAVFEEGAGPTLDLIALEDAQADNTDPGVTYASFAATTLRRNDSGRVAFGASLSGPGFDTSNNQVILQQNNLGELAIAAREGDQAPGVVVGRQFDSFFYLRQNNADDLAFLARIKADGGGVVSNAIFSDSGGSGLALLAQSGDPIPEQPAGTTFGGIDFQFIEQNNAGDVAFLGNVLIDSPFSFFRAIFTSSDADPATLLIAVGDSIDVAPDPVTEDLREIASFSGFIDLNDNGELLFGAVFVDGTSGLFVIDAIAGPVACSPADLTTTGATLMGQPGFGVPDGEADLDDLGYFVGRFLANDPAADLTTTGATLMGQPGFGVPDGVIDLDDLGYFLGVWLEGCI